MKKLFTVAFCCLVLSLSCALAQRSTGAKDVLVDSIAVRIVNTSGLKKTLAARSDVSDKDVALVEYLTYKVVCQLLSEAVSPLSDEEVGKLGGLLDSRLYAVLHSTALWQSFARCICDAYMLEVGAASDFSYKIRDREYAALAERVYSECLPFVGDLKKNVTSALSDRKSFDRNAMQRVMDALPHVFTNALMEHLTYEDMASVDLEAFDVMTTSGLGGFLLDSTKVAQIVRNRELPGEDVLEEVARYVTYDRGNPRFLAPVDGQDRNIVEKKYTYSGMTRDGVPHGNGRLTDKKGVEYWGDFKNGVRHGHIAMSEPGQEEPVHQVWYRGKLRKDIPSVSGAEGVMKAPVLCDGRIFGYGTIYAPNVDTYTTGFFIDGKLNHEGKIVSPGMEMTGVFRDGQWLRGSIVWKSPEWKQRMFVGVALGSEDVRYGTMRYVSKDGSYRKDSQGYFVGEYLEGKGKVTVSSTKSDVETDGFFVKGVLWGKATIRKTVKTHPAGTEEKYVYEGWNARGRAHGDAKVVFTFTGLPDKVYRVKRYGVKLALNGPGFGQVTMEGYFKEGRLVKGKVLFSDGSFMQGTFADGELSEGRMLRYYSDGSVYDGECRNGRFDGYGRLTYADGTVYEGMFSDGYAEGQYELPVGQTARYDSGYPKKDSKREEVFRFDNLPVEKGVARLVRAAGVKIMVRGISSVEVVCEGVFDGKNLKEGKVTISDGNWMEGVFEDGVLVKGRAKTLDKYGTIYVGEMKNGFPHGKGKCTYKNGTWFEGNFANGNRMSGTHYSIDGRVIKVYK